MKMVVIFLPADNNTVPGEEVWHAAARRGRHHAQRGQVLLTIINYILVILL